MPQRFTTRPEIRGTFGAVASTHWIASAVGMAILERGGNAFDAAVATGFVLQIVEPHLNGPGGEVPIILHRAGDSSPRVICGQGVAPGAATIEAMRALGLDHIPGTGLLSAVVPGAFDAWMIMLRDYGTMRLADVLEPAIGYAQNGFPLVYRAAASIHAVAGHFRDAWPSSAEVWLSGGSPPMPGQLITTPAIAKTYSRIVEEAAGAGPDRIAEIEAARLAFYEGFVAEAVDRHCRCEFADSTGQMNAGLLTGADMAAWRAGFEKTTTYETHGLTVHKTGPWGQGPVFLQSLALLEGFDLAAMDPVGADFTHTVVECMKLAFADRDIHYGDPDFVDVPLETLLSPEYNDARRRLIGGDASGDLLAGSVGGTDVSDRVAAIEDLARAGAERDLGGGEPTFADLPDFEGDTVHLDVVDRFGNMVSATPSGGWLQSSPAIPELGFNLSTRAQMFWLDERLPSALAPGKRPRTTLTPTLVTRDGAPVLALGSPGGDQQDQWGLVLFLRRLHHRQNLQAAIDAPLFNSKHLVWSFAPRTFEPKRLFIEGRYGLNVRADLTARGHLITVEDNWSLGRLCAVARSSAGAVSAAATPRFMQAYAIGR